MNGSIAAGYRRGLGLGESLGRLILGESLDRLIPGESPGRPAAGRPASKPTAFKHPEVSSPAGERLSEAVAFKHPEVSILAAGVRLRVPVTIHVGIGTDIIDQHASFDGAAKGGASGFDFSVYAASVAKLRAGGVVLNIGSAVTGPEVFLKAVSMAANVGEPPGPIVTANFDLRPVAPADANDEATPTYYFRDNKSVVTRIPEAFGGRGYYVRGHFRETLPALHRLLTGAGKAR